MRLNLLWVCITSITLFCVCIIMFFKMIFSVCLSRCPLGFRLFFFYIRITKSCCMNTYIAVLGYYLNRLDWLYVVSHMATYLDTCYPDGGTGSLGCSWRERRPVGKRKSRWCCGTRPKSTVHPCRRHLRLHRTRPYLRSFICKFIAFKVFFFESQVQ